MRYKARMHPHCRTIWAIGATLWFFAAADVAFCHRTLQQDTAVQSDLVTETTGKDAASQAFQSMVSNFKQALDFRRGGNGEGTTAERDSSPVSAFVSSLFMILVTELGDETFIIAAIMAMRHGKAIVYAGAMSALGFMTIISTALGYILPNLISRRATHAAATVLYTFFGLRLYYIAYYAKPNVNEELEEVEAKLEQDEKGQSRWRRELSRFCTPVFLEAFVLTFLAEWGDRSQIATISLAAQHDPYGVTVGAIFGHSICTGIAVVGGALLARRISQRTVAIAGGTLFLIFAALNLVSRN